MEKETMTGLSKEHEYAYLISQGLRRTIQQSHPTIPQAGYCEKEVLPDVYIIL